MDLSLLRCLRLSLCQAVAVEGVRNPSVITALSLVTETLFQSGEKSMSEVGRTVWFWGHGQAVIVHEHVEVGPTTFDLYMIDRKSTYLEILPGGFVYEY